MNTYREPKINDNKRLDCAKWKRKCNPRQMKRWQARGEVSDSDDEDGTLDPEPQSFNHQRLQKRASSTDSDSKSYERPKDVSHNAPETFKEASVPYDHDLANSQTTEFGALGGKREVSRQQDNSPRSSIQAELMPANALGCNIHEPILTGSPVVKIDSSVLHGVTQTNHSYLDVPVNDTPEQAGNISDDSSVLSERSVSPPPGFPFLNLTAQRPPADLALTNTEQDRFAARTRQLRVRKEIQLHPYLLDRVKYMKQCRQRGMRPVRLQEYSQAPDESQDGGAYDLLGPDHLASIAPSQEQTITTVRNSASFNDAFSVLDDASQLSDLELTSSRRTKRQKLMHNRSNASFLARSHTASMPPSPPHDDSQLYAPAELDSDHASSVASRLLGSTTPAQLPTPQISSDVNHPSLGEDSDSDLDSRPKRRLRLPAAKKLHMPVVIDVKSSSESSSSEEVEAGDEHLRRVQKRIKGVLPASWLKLDFRKQQQRQQLSPVRPPRVGSMSPPRSAMRKGLAQRIRPQHFHKGSQHEISFEIDSDDEQNTVSVNTSLRSGPESSDVHGGQFTRDMGREPEEGATEHDWFDPMFGRPRTHSSARSKGRKMQTRLTGAFRKPDFPQQDLSNERTNRRNRIGLPGTHLVAQHKALKQRKPQNASVRLSIADAHMPPSVEGNGLPQFVRVAMRRTRHQRDRGRHSPTNKLIRLATERDTEDAISTLRSWQTGQLSSASKPQVASQRHIHGTSQHCTSRRIPLSERSSNQIQPTHLSPAELEVTPKPHSTVSARAKPWQSRQPRVGSDAIHEAYTEPLSPDKLNSETLNRVVRTSLGKEKGNFPRAARIRGAQIETLATEFDNRYRAAAFERRMYHLTEQAARINRQTTSVEQRIDNYFDDQEESAQSLAVETTSGYQGPDQNPADMRPAGIPKIFRRPRKGRARRVDTEAREYRQPEEPVPGFIGEQLLATTVPQDTSSDLTTSVLRGLNAYASKYPIDFDIRPFRFGVFFQAATFVGSGEFRDAIQYSTRRNLDQARGQLRVRVDDQTLEWSSWTEDVATGFARTARIISSLLQSLVGNTNPIVNTGRYETVGEKLEYLLRSIIRYCSNFLWFVDFIDRQACCETLYRFALDLMDAVSEVNADLGDIVKITIQVQQYTLIIAHQALQLCNQTSADANTRVRFRQLVLRAAESLTRCILPTRLNDLQIFYEDMRKTTRLELGISSNDLPITAIVLLHHTLDNSKLDRTFWQIANGTLHHNTSTLCDVSNMENLWYSMFTLLPALEIDLAGIAKLNSRLGKKVEDWTLVRGLVARVLELYESSTQVHGLAVNQYIRCLLSRCHHLINEWGWWRCEQLLGTIYDFFARRGLAFLPNEESRGSPRFLEQLAGDPELDVEADDRVFHIFLKLLATALRGMQEYGIYEDRKIGGIAWRFVPSHGRTYRKDVELQTADLDALRNHFDLLTTLYYGLPRGHRPRIELFRNLVDHNASHREACRLSIRSWANMATFQASTSEPSETLQPIVEWYRDMTKSAIAQYRLARSEAEQDSRVAQEQGVSNITTSLVETTVARNQRQIAVILVDALAALKRVLQSTSSIQNVNNLVAGTSFYNVLELFDPLQRRLSSAVFEVFAVANTALDVQHTLQPEHESQRTDNDSQDFGDSSALEELVASEVPGHVVLQALHDPVSQFVSNVLGADEFAEDALLQSLVDLWIRLMSLNVQQGNASWTSYIDDYSLHSWARLRDTLQKRKITPYFMARIVEHSTRDTHMTNEIITVWILSLVEREAMLKYQHMLTSTLLNFFADDPLLQNLPFARDNQRGMYQITLDEFRQRRLGLVASILSNMRQTGEQAAMQGSCEHQETRMVHTTMLRKLMHAMKANFTELQTKNSTDVADGSVQGAYVEFVQQVVSFLQQYTTEICPIDHFFTDSAAFPLPATDPTYVIGRLRSYVPKLHDSKTRKQLAVFIQTVSERAATDSQQAYLVNQLVAAMTGGNERGDSKAPSLRHIVLTSIFPAYFDNVLVNEFDWILALPMLEASQQILNDLLYTVNTSDSQSSLASTQILGALISCVIRQCTYLSMSRAPKWRLQTYRILSEMFNMARACLTLGSYLRRLSVSDEAVTKGLRQLRSTCASIKACLISDKEDVSGITFQDRLPCLWPDTLTFAANQIKRSMGENWSIANGHYVLRRGSVRKEVAVHLSGSQHERDQLLRSLDDFSRSYDTVFQPRKGARTVLPQYQGLADLHI